MTSSSGIRRITRDFPPFHYIFKLEPFSLLAETGFEKYESETFEAAGHKWRLALYPNGDSKSIGKGFISLYLVIADETENLPRNWEANVIFRLFVFDQIRNKYLTIDDGTVKRFNWMKTEWGFAQLLSLDSFKDASNGYLIGDSCVFGAEVFSVEPNCEWECLSLVKQTRNNTITLKMENFSKLDEECYESPIHTIESLKWKLRVYPRGDGEFKGKELAVFLVLVKADELPPKRKVYVKYKLRVRDQINEKNEEIIAESCFNAASVCWGYPQFMLLKDLHDAFKGYLVNDSLIVEAEINVISKVKRLREC